MEVKNIIQTCEACPSQWEGSLKDGRMFYVRYRWGGLSVRISEGITSDVTDAVRGEVILSEDIGDGFDGSLEQSDLIDKMEEAGFIFN